MEVSILTYVIISSETEKKNVVYLIKLALQRDIHLSIHLTYSPSLWSQSSAAQDMGRLLECLIF